MDAGNIARIGGSFSISNLRRRRNLREMNSRFSKLLLAAVAASLTFSFPLQAEPVSATIKTPPPAETGYFKLGTTKNPAGREISVNSRSLLFDGQPVFPVMGEFHYSRCPQNDRVRSPGSHRSLGLANGKSQGHICRRL